MNYQILNQRLTANGVHEYIIVRLQDGKIISKSTIYTDNPSFIDSLVTSANGLKVKA